MKERFDPRYQRENLLKETLALLQQQSGPAPQARNAAFPKNKTNKRGVFS